MDVQVLIRLAHQADLEGNYRVADKLTERAMRLAAPGFLGSLKQKFKNMVNKSGRDMDLEGINHGPVTFGGGNQANPIAGAGGRAGTSGTAAGVTGDIAQMGEAEAEAVAKATGGGRRRTTKTTETSSSSGPGAEGTTTETKTETKKSRGGGTRAKADADAGNNMDAAQRGGTSGAVGAGGAGGGNGPIDQSSHGNTYAPVSYSRSPTYHGNVGMGAGGVVAITALPTLLAAYGLYTANGRVIDKNTGKEVPPQQLPPAVKNVMSGGGGKDFKANPLSLRAQANQMQNADAAQQFIEARKSNPNFKSAQDFWVAATQAGHNPSMVNQIVALAKAEGYKDLTPATH